MAPSAKASPPAVPRTSSSSSTHHRSLPAPSFVESRSANQLVRLFYGALSVVTVILWVANANLHDMEASKLSNVSASRSKLAVLSSNAGGMSKSTTRIETRTVERSSAKHRDRSFLEQKKQKHDDDSTVFHIVFSTGCNAFQDWQSYVFFFQTLQSGQTGHVTRVASGCADEAAAQALRDKFQEQIVATLPASAEQSSSLQFHLHITPDYSKLIPDMTYKFFNKPLGLRHWMEHGLGYSLEQPEKEEDDKTIIVILDPDQFILTPLRSNYTGDTSMRWVHPSEDGTYTIRKGRPFAQMYAFGDTFMRKVNTDVPKIVAAAPVFGTNQTQSTDQQSPLYSWSTQTVHRHYDAGPPYMAVASDMYRIVATWAAIAVPVYELTTGHLSEMYAYSTAAAHVGLPHVLGYTFMVSNPDMGDRPEGWDAIDAAPVQDVCRMDAEATFAPPPILHYCQRYYLGPYFFSKYKLPKQFLNDCSHPLLKDPMEAEQFQYDWPAKYDSSITPNGQFNRLSPKDRKRHAFLLCHSISKINRAVEFYKRKHCAEGEANWNKTFVFPMDKGKTRKVSAG